MKLCKGSVLCQIACFCTEWQKYCFICEIMSGSMGSFGYKLYLVVYYASILACFIEFNNGLCQVSFIYLLCSVSFSIRFHAQCSIHNANLFSAVYQACTKLSLRCYLHWFSTRSACLYSFPCLIPSSALH